MKTILNLVESSKFPNQLEVDSRYAWLSLKGFRIIFILGERNCSACVRISKGMKILSSQKLTYTSGVRPHIAFISSGSTATSAGARAGAATNSRVELLGEKE
jgi:hypothetical protein